MNLPGKIHPPAGHGVDRCATGRLILWAAAVVFLAGAVLLGISFTPQASFEYLRGLADSKAVDGSADFLTPQWYEDLLFRGRLLASLLIVAGVLPALLRRRIAAVISRIGLVKAEMAGYLRSLAGRVAVVNGLWLWLAAAALVVGAALRLLYLFEPIRYDEAYTWIYYASHSPLQALVYYDVPNNHILHSLLVMISTWIFGSAEWAIRLPAFVAGVLLIPAAFLLALELTGEGAAASFAAVLTASSSYLIDYSVNARGYTLVCLFTLVLLLAGREMCVGKWRAAGPVLFVAAGAAGLATIPIMIYPLAVAAVWVILGVDRKRERKVKSPLPALAVSLAVIVALALAWYAPALTVSGPGAFLEHGVQKLDMYKWVAGQTDLARILFEHFHRDLPLPLTGCLAALFLAGCFRLPALTIALLVPFVLMFIQGVAPITHPRMFTFLLVIYLVVAAAGSAEVGRRLISSAGIRMVRPAAAAFAMAWLAAGAWMITLSRSPALSGETGLFPEASWAIEMIKPRLARGEAVLSGLPLIPLVYYGLREGIPLGWFLSRGMVEKGEYPGIWMVADRDSRESSAEAIMEANRLERLQYGHPRLIAARGSAEIYYLARADYAGGTP